jgi:hypothetical protein
MFVTAVLALEDAQERIMALKDGEYHKTFFVYNPCR